jgi:4-carboxymuconolactone decarboxylase
VATQEEKQAYVDDMARKRGYVLEFHKVMAEQDFDAFQTGIEPTVEVFEGS